MKALTYTGPETMEFGDAEEPIMAPGNAIVRVSSVGICGSDIHGFLGHDARRPAPLILGHEASGVIDEGEGIGRRVTINPLITCGTCEGCVEGRLNLCRTRKILSMVPLQGAFAERVAMLPENFVDVPEHVSWDAAALTEPMACGWHLVRIAERALFQDYSEADCLIIGGGAIGLGVALVLADRGAKSVTISEPNLARHPALKAAGDFDVVTPEKVRDDSAHLVADAVGIGATRKASGLAVKPGGVIAHIGLGDSAEGFDTRYATLQEVTFIGSYCYTPEDFRATADAIFDGRLGALDWVETRPLSEGQRAFEDILGGRAAAPKIILRP